MALKYFSLAASLNNADSQYFLGVEYLFGYNVTHDIKKSIYFLSQAVKQNHTDAQFMLGVIYYTENEIPHDVPQAIHYLTLAADKKHTEAQYHLGIIYSKVLDGTKYINKAIHYFTLASKQNHPKANLSLGMIYFDDKFVHSDINKSIYYLSLAADQNNPEAQYRLGVIYEKCDKIQTNLEKAIYYYNLASNKNFSKAQYKLGLIYMTRGETKKGIELILLSSHNRYKEANFAQGYLHHIGLNIEKDINKAIHFYKEASSFNNQYAKNNLGVIYKKGFGEEIKANSANAIVYFEEAIRQKNDHLSMYNLANIYIYDESYKQNINKSFELLIKSSDKFFFSYVLFSILCLRKFGLDIDRIKEEVQKYSNKVDEKISQIKLVIKLCKMQNKSMFNQLYEYFRNLEFVYNINLEEVSVQYIEDIDRIKKNSKPKYLRDITTEFYEGFGYDLLT